MKIIAISGMIGSGKTTLCDALAKAANWTVVREDVTKNPFLPLFYDKGNRWALASQITFMLNKTQAFEEISNQSPSFVLIDRTIQEDFFVFGSVLSTYRNISPEEHQLLERIYKLLLPAWPAPDLSIYTEDTDENCFQRLLSRGDAFESKMEFGYLKSVGNAYRNWKATHLPEPKYEVYPAQMDFRDSKVVDTILTRIKALLHKS